MEELSRDELIGLYDIYGNLLTDKQRLYFEDYYYMDLSLAEIAENYNISRNAVFDQIKRASEALYNYEALMHLNKKYKKIEALNISDDIKKQITDILWED
ncbi:MAG: DNA-binding protein [Acholeplasmatales bacterium]|nr:DNA-binding protein [Acholeplasmatales bacterium]